MSFYEFLYNWIFFIIFKYNFVKLGEIVMFKSWDIFKYYMIYRLK